MKVRPFRAEDAPAVAALWQYWFKDKTLVPDSRLTDLARRIYAEDPNVDDEITSLIAEGPDGQVLGFLGVSVMPVEVDGASGKMAGVFPSVVHPDASSTVATFLLRRFLAGPQVLTFSDGGHVKFERIWEALGGQIAQMQSLRWIVPFRPLETAAGSGSARKVVGRLQPGFVYLAKGADQVLRGLSRRRLRAPAAGNDYVTEPLTPSELVAVAAKLDSKARLRPLYDPEHLAWQFGEMSKIADLGEFTAHVVKTRNGSPVGWYVYYLKRGGVSRLFALQGLEKHLDGVTGHLLADADRRGAGAVMGRMEPKLRRVMAGRTDLIVPKGSLMMVHSKDPSLMSDALLGRLAFTRLQGENWYWWAIASDAPH